MTAATIANTFSYPAAFDYSVTWTASGLSLDLGAAPSGAPAAPSGLKLNSRAAVAPIAAVAAGRLNVTLSAVVGGRREDEFFSTDLGGLNATLKGCTLGLLTASRAWVFECKRAKVDLPMYTFNPKVCEMMMGLVVGGWWVGGWWVTLWLGGVVPWEDGAGWEGVRKPE